MTLRRTMLGSWARPGLVVAFASVAASCGGTKSGGDAACADCTPEPPHVTIAFAEIADDRVPDVAQTDFVEPNHFFGIGAAIGDVDGDARPDVFLATGGLFLNREDPRGFRLEAAPANVPAIDFTPIAAALGDFDRDGDLDLAVGGFGGVRLFANDGAGFFRDVTAAAGVAGASTDVVGSLAWGDVDGDGFLDLAVGCYGKSPDVAKGTVTFHGDEAQTSYVYANRRDGTFAPIANVPLVVRALVAAFADFDGDGAVDVYFGDDGEIPLPDGMPRHDRVLLSRGLDDATGLPVLVESAEDLGVSTARATMGCAVGNAARGAGWDLFFSDIQTGWLSRSDGSGQRYKDVSSAFGNAFAGTTADRHVLWGSAFADLDGDGFEDLLVSEAPIHQDEPGADTAGPLLLRNDRAGKLALVPLDLGGAMRVRAVLFADLDRDGDDDFVGAPFFDRFRFVSNDTKDRPSVRVDLAPSVSAPGAAGAVVVAKSGNVVQKRMRVFGGQPHSHGEGTIDFGVGAASSVDLQVTWPSGAVQTVPNVPRGTRTTVTEPAWIRMTDSHPGADGTTGVGITIDVAAAGLGGPGSHVTWTSEGATTDATCDEKGVALIEIPPRSAKATVRGTIAIDGKPVPAHPAIDFGELSPQLFRVRHERRPVRGDPRLELRAKRGDLRGVLVRDVALLALDVEQGPTQRGS